MPERDITPVIGPDECQRIADWSKRMQLPGTPDVRLVVDYDQPRGQPVLDDEKREARMHPADAIALRRWANEREWLRWKP